MGGGDEAGRLRRVKIRCIGAERHEPEQGVTNVSRRLAALTAAMGVLAAVLVTGAGVRTVMHTSRAPRLLTEGIAAQPCAPQDVIIVPVHRNVRYDGASSVLLPAAPATGSRTLLAPS